jgi:outer membrane lipoprotein carrier protein
MTGTTLTERGIFYYKKPKRMRWDYSEPPGKLLIVNPDFMWFYVPEDNQVYIQKTDDALKSQLAVKFLTGLGALKDDFNLSFADPSPSDDKGNYFITLRPKEQTGGIQDLTLTIDRHSYYITGYRLTDMYGSKNSYFFQNISVNNDLPDSLFEYVPPGGVKIERLPLAGKGRSFSDL